MNESVIFHAKINVASPLNYGMVFSLRRERDREREGGKVGEREKREHYTVMSQRGLKNDFNHIPMWLIVNFQGQKFDNNFNKSCDFVQNYFDICL